MIFIQMTGLSGAGKTTIATVAKQLLLSRGMKTEIIDGDEFREHICKGLGFSKEDRMENIRRLSYIGNLLSRNGITVILSAINPYEVCRKEVEMKYPSVKTVWVNCSLPVLLERDTKGLYKKALLPNDSVGKITNLSGVNDPYEVPVAPALILNTDKETIGVSVDRLMKFIMKEGGG